MTFNTPIFIFYFFPITYVLFLLLKDTKFRKAFLVIIGFLFYSFGQISFLPLFIGSAIFNYFIGKLLQRMDKGIESKLLLAAAVTVNLLPLCLFKYSVFVIQNINSIFGCSLTVKNTVLPIGISFYTFQGLSYIIDIYREKDNAAEGIADFLVFYSLYPKILAGPIETFSNLRGDIAQCRFTADGAAEGLRLFVRGLSKKVLISGTVAAAADRIFLHGTCGSCAAAWIAALSYLIQIYYDFSGYSDMAIGLGRALGFRFGNNFNYPYSALTIKDFWKRWHISLSSWFRDYLYIPLGGNRKGKVRTVLNKLFVFFCTGLWHGANWTFVLWGLGHGLLSSLEDFFPNTIAVLKKRNMGKMFLRIVTLLAVTVLFVLFRADSLTDGFSIVRDMFAFKNGTVPNNYLAEILSPAYFAAMLFGIVFSFPVLQKIKIRNTIVESALCIILFAVCIFSVSSGGFSPFIYFQF